jgi:hypothetical protein
MSAIALELHEVLEEEFVSTGGGVLPSPDDPFTVDDVLDEALAAQRIGVRPEALLARLERFRNNLSRESDDSAAQLFGIGKLTACTKRLLATYDAADDVMKRRINRRILNDVLGDALRGALPLPVIAADQIIDFDCCRATLQTWVHDDYPDAGVLAAKLESLRRTVDPKERTCPATLFGEAAQLSCNTKLLIADYETCDDDQRRKINRRIIDEIFSDAITRYRDLRLSQLYAELHKRCDADARTALCISGGGIRSATFALGVMQGLAGRGLLKCFDYLSTVSGGGYIGSWLSSWVRRHPDGIVGVERDLAAIEPRTPAAERKAQLERNVVPPDGTETFPHSDVSTKLQPEVKPIRHLREYSNYLTPRVGMLSGDTWAFAALYLRNLTINLLILVPLLALVLAWPRLSAFALNHVERNLPLWLPVAVANFSLLTMFWYIGVSRPVRHGSEADLPRPARWFAPRNRFFIFCFFPALGAALGISFSWAKWSWLVSSKGMTGADRFIALGGIAIAMLVTIVVPCTAYFERYWHASYAARRESIAVSADSMRSERIVAESVAAIAATSGAALLYWFFAKVFGNPFERLQSVNLVSPFLVTHSVFTSPRLLFLCFGGPVVLFILFLQATIFVAASSKYNEDYDREWWGRAGGWLLGGSIAWMALNGISIFGPLAIYRFPTIIGALGGISGLVSLVLGRSPKSPAKQKGAGDAGVIEKALTIAVPLFCGVLLAGISWLTTLIIQKSTQREPARRTLEASMEAVLSGPEREVQKGYKQSQRTKPTAFASNEVLDSQAHLRTIEETTKNELLAIFLVGAAAFGASFAIGANRFSLHALYRNRLIRAYLGASRYNRDPDKDTGFDPYDNIHMYKLRQELLWSSSFRELDPFIAELRHAQAGLEAKPLSATIVRLLQPATQDLLTDTWEAEKLDKAMRILDSVPAGDLGDAHAAAVRKEIGNVKAHLPRTVKRLGKITGTTIAAKDFLRLQVQAKEEVKRSKEALLAEGTRGELIDALFQDLNRILIEDDLRGERAPALKPVARAITNRRIFDETYKEWIVPMPPLKRGGDDPRAARSPLHVVNAALNLVSGDNLAWQQRQAESFTFSPLHSGSPFVGYRDSRQYGDGRRGISLGTAVAISGAAASPNQGYHSSPALAFLLTMFNVRLGWWLGNPGAAGKKTFDKENPKSGINLLVREMMGDTNDTYDWVYLSDGGHFENLGMYEMVLRRCRYIVVSDAGCDPKFTFEDLGNALRKIRTDLGIPIEFTNMPMRSRDEDEPWDYVALGTINYGAVDGPGAKPGTLIYLKPGYYRDERLPKDVVNYAKERIAFPHETTADQWFSESQFESYRALGHHVIHHIMGDLKPKNVAEFAHRLAETDRDAEAVYVPVVARKDGKIDRKRGWAEVVLHP